MELWQDALINCQELLSTCLIQVKDLHRRDFEAFGQDAADNLTSIFECMWSHQAESAVAEERCCSPLNGGTKEKIYLTVNSTNVCTPMDCILQVIVP